MALLSHDVRVFHTHLFTAVTSWQSPPHLLVIRATQEAADGAEKELVRLLFQIRYRQFLARPPDRHH